MAIEKVAAVSLLFTVTAGGTARIAGLLLVSEAAADRVAKPTTAE